MRLITRFYFRYKWGFFRLGSNRVKALMNNLHLAVQFFLQLAVILLFCRIVGAIAARFGQPQVVAEMIAGVLLGPSLFGLLAPEWQKLAVPVGQNPDHARHPELSVPRVATRPRALHVRRRHGIPRGHHPQAAQELDRGFRRRHDHAVRPRRGAGLGFFYTPSCSPKKPA
jgi:hypothetical protein